MLLVIGLLVYITPKIKFNTSLSMRIYHGLLYVVPRVCVSRRTVQCRVRHLTPTYVMTNNCKSKYLVSCAGLQTSFLTSFCDIQQKKE